jgi:hypothetical protein
VLLSGSFHVALKKCKRSPQQDSIALSNPITVS